MICFRAIHFGRILVRTLGVLACSSALIHPGFASEAALTTEQSDATKNTARTNSGASIDCITPDGRLIAVPSARGRDHSSAAALIMEGDTLSCPLQEGETTFIISFPKTSLLDRFTFVNENAEVQGEMRIAVSNYRLPPDSPKWTDVSGKTEFTNKRLFNLSMVGVEARYVKLSFQVQKGGRIASLALLGAVPLEAPAEGEDAFIRIANTLGNRRDAIATLAQIPVLSIVSQ